MTTYACVCGSTDGLLEAKGERHDGAGNVIETTVSHVCAACRARNGHITRVKSYPYVMAVDAVAAEMVDLASEYCLTLTGVAHFSGPCSVAGCDETGPHKHTP